MPFRMGPTGWYAWPYMAHWMTYRDPYGHFPYYPFPWFFTREEEKTYLEGQVNILEEQLAQVKKRLEELKKEGKEAR